MRLGAHEKDDCTILPPHWTGRLNGMPPLCDTADTPSPPKPLLSCSPDGSIIISASMQGLFADPKLGPAAWQWAIKACSVMQGVV